MSDISVEKSDPAVEREFAPMNKKSSGGILLVPQPSDDPKDPLNWSMSSKITTLFVISLASFATTWQGVANGSGLFQQAAVYHRTPVEITYSISAGIAGLAVGPLIWAPLSKKFGRCACIMWGTVLSLATGIWSALMTGQNDYVSFIISRLFGSLFGSVTTTVGAGAIVETFFLHQKGKAFSFYTIMILLGTIAGPTLSGFIVEGAPWPVQYWACVGLQGVVIILCFLFLYETGWTRSGGEVFPRQPDNFVKNRAATYFFTQKVVPDKSTSELVQILVSPIALGVTPTGLLAGFFLFITFAWGVAVNTLIAVYLQTPVKFGGYGFTPMQNAEFTFTAWVSIAASQLYTHLVSDRIPLWLCKRFGGGAWKPEYRLHCLWFPALFCLPIGLGLFGAALQYKLHYMVLALGNFLIFFGVIAIVPIVITYVVECFNGHANEAATMLNLYRLVFGLVIPFFIDQWEEAVTVGWVFGTAAFLTIASYLLVLALMFWGPKIRSKNGLHTSNGEGLTIVGSKTEE